jgi:hypothetical protein
MCQLFVTLLKNNIKRSCLYVDECDVKTNFNITQNNTIIICIIKGYLMVTASYKWIKSTIFGPFGPIVGKWVW